jgi:choline dehydrogenase-like flavoprotein
MGYSIVVQYQPYLDEYDTDAGKTVADKLVETTGATGATLVTHLARGATLTVCWLTTGAPGSSTTLIIKIFYFII